MGKTLRDRCASQKLSPCYSSGRLGLRLVLRKPGSRIVAPSMLLIPRTGATSRRANCSVRRRNEIAAASNANMMKTMTASCTALRYTSERLLEGSIEAAMRHDSSADAQATPMLVPSVRITLRIHRRRPARAAARHPMIAPTLAIRRSNVSPSATRLCKSRSDFGSVSAFMRGAPANTCRQRSERLTRNHHAPLRARFHNRYLKPANRRLAKALRRHAVGDGVPGPAHAPLPPYRDLRQKLPPS